MTLASAPGMQHSHPAFTQEFDMKHQETSINHPARKPTTSERGQNPSADADTASSAGEPKRDADRKPTPNEIMNEQASPPDEQGNRDQSDKPHVSG